MAISPRVERLLRAAVVLVGIAAITLAATRMLSGLRDAHDDELQRDVDRAARHAATLHRVAQLELTQVAQRVARSELVAWLGLMSDYEATLASQPEPFVVDFAKRVAVFRPHATRSALEAEGRAFAADCVPVCRARAVAEALARARAAEAPAMRPDRLAVFDGEGQPLSDVALTPVVVEALRSRTIVRDFERWPGTELYHLLVAAPVLEGAVLRGVVLVGRAIGGVRLERDAERVGAALTWVVSGTIGVAATTLGDDAIGELGGDAFVTGREVIAGNVHITPTVIASRPRDDALWDESQRQLGWVALAIALLSLAATLLFATRRAPG